MPTDGSMAFGLGASPAQETSVPAAGPLRIAMLVRDYPAFSETFILDQIQGLRQLGHDVTVFALYEGDVGVRGADQVIRTTRYLIGPHRPFAAKWLRAVGRALRSLAFPTALARLAPAAAWHLPATGEAIHAIPVLRGSAGTFDVVHAHFGPTGLLALLLRRMRLVTGPLVTTFHGYDATVYPRLHGDDVYRPLFAAGEVFTVNSRFTRDRVMELGAPPGSVHRLPVGADLDRIPFQPRRGPAEGPARLLTVGRLYPFKGIEFGLRAVARLVDAGHDVTYTVVGGGSLAEALRSEADRLGLSHRVSFTGPLPFGDVLAKYRVHHIYLQPGIVTPDGQVEAQGRVLLEAQAAGMPVVATDVGGMPDTVAPDAGRLVPPGSPEALADAVAELLSDPGSWPDLGAAGRRYVEEHFGEQYLLDRVIRIYRSVAEGSSGGSPNPGTGSPEDGPQ